MTVWIDADEMYPDYEISLTPTRYREEVELPDDLVYRYMATRSAYMAERNTLIALMSAHYRAATTKRREEIDNEIV